LPESLAAGVGEFAVERVRQVDTAEAFGEISFVQTLDALEMLPERRNDGIGQHGYAIFIAFGVTDDHGAALEVNILDAQAEALQEAQPRAIEEPGHQLVSSRQVGDDLFHLVSGEDGGQVLGFLGPHDADGIDELLAQNVTIQEEQRSEGLILCRSGDVLVYGQVGEERRDPSTGSGHVSAPPSSLGWRLSW